MIYYVTAFSEDPTLITSRQMVLSQAAVNRGRAVAEVMASVEAVTIVNCALCRCEQAQDAVTETVCGKIKVHHPALPNGGGAVAAAKACIQFLKANLQRGDRLAVYNANHITTPIAIASRLQCGTKVLYELEELYSRDKANGAAKKLLFRLCEALMRGLAAGSISVSKKLLTGSLKRKPAVISYGYHVSAGKVEEKANEHLQVLYAGRLDEEGGISLLLEALQRADREMTVYVTGSGALESTVREYRCANPKVRFAYLGFVAKETLDQLMATADVCVSCLRTDCAFSQASFPSKVYQYLAHGGTVLSSDVPALEDVKSAFPNLQCYRGDDPAEIAAGLERQRILQPQERLENIANFQAFYQKKNTELVDFLKNRI